MGTAGGVTNFAGLYGKRRGQMTQLVRGVVDELVERIVALNGMNDPQDGTNGRIRALVRHLGLQARGRPVARGGRREAAVPCARGLDDPRRRAHRAPAGRDQVGRQAIRAMPSSTPAAVPTWRPSRACSSRSATATAAACSRPPCSASACVDAPAALEAVGEFKAINDFMARAEASKPGAYRFPREGAILRPNKDPRANGAPTSRRSATPRAAR